MAASAEKAFNTVVADSSAPAATLTGMNGTANGPVTFTITFNEAVTGFTASDVAVTNGSKGSFAALSSTVYTLLVTPNANSSGNLLVSIPAGAAFDLASNGNAAASITQPYNTTLPDTSAPTLTIDAAQAGTATGPVTFNFVFNEPVSGFETDDITVTNGSKGNLTGSGALYSLVVTPNANTSGTLSIDVPAGAATDPTGNGNVAALTSKPFDTAVPTVGITDTTEGVTRNPITFAFTFSETVTGFTASDIAVNGGSKGAFSAVSGSVYTLLVTPNANSTGNVTIDVPANAASDAAGNPNSAALQITQAFDTAAPTVGITDNVTGTASGDTTFTFTFNEAVTGFDAGDVTVIGGTKGAFGSPNPAIYTLVVSPPANATGDLTVSVPAGAASDSAGNSSTAGAQVTQSYNTDTTAPTVNITSSASGTATGPVTFTFTFSEPVTGFAASDINVANGSKGTFTASSSTVYTLVVTPTSNATGNITVDVPADVATDAGGSGSLAAAQATQAFDTQKPGVTITDNVTAHTTNGNVTFTFTFSEAVTGFTSSDITLNGGTAGAFTAVSPTLYTLVATPTPNATGNLTANVAAGVANDLAGHLNTAAQAAGSQAVDTVAPTVRITDNLTGTATGVVTFNIAFSEVVTGFEASDIVVTGGIKGELSGVGKDYQVTVTPASKSTGTMTVDIAAGAAQDAGGNDNTVAGQNSQEFNSIYIPGVTQVIDLGSYGKLIHPVKVDGENWYYYWDLSGDGTTNNTGSLNGGHDWLTHDVLDEIFTQDVNGNVGGGNTTDTYRWTTLNVVKVALPTANGGWPYPNGINAFQPGTAVDNDPAGETNVTYDDLLAIWDGHNGTGTNTSYQNGSQLIVGAPWGWRPESYWSATPTATSHAMVSLLAGQVWDEFVLREDIYVALLVV